MNAHPVSSPHFAILRRLYSVACLPAILSAVGLAKVGALAAAGLLLAGCVRRETPVAAGLRTQTLHLSNGAEPRDLDPQIIIGQPDINIVHALFEGLTEVDPHDCHPVPGVAERWESSIDGLTWTFHLRTDAQWSNRDPVTAHDFVYSFKRLLSPALGSDWAMLLFCVTNAETFHAGKITDIGQVGIRATDDHTLVFSLTLPVPYLPVLATHYALLPVHRATIEKFGRTDQRGSAWTRPGNLVGNGAFALKGWSPHDAIRVTKSATYWDRDRVRLREAVFFPIENSAVSEASFRAGQLHTAEILPEKVLAYRNDSARAPLLHESPLLGTNFYRVNCTVAPLNDVRVRRALLLAIDRDQIARRIVHCDTPAFSLTPPGCAGYTADRTVVTDMGEARRLLAAAGFPGGKNFPRLAVLFYAGTATDQAVTEALQAMWRTNLGIEVTLSGQEFKAVVDAVQILNYQISQYGWIGDYLDPTTFLDALKSDNGNNQTGWKSADYDKLMAQTARMLDQAKRYELLRQAESLMLREAPILPLYYLQGRSLRLPAVKGWHDNLLDLHPLKFVYLEK